jgi:hypothetical protein
MASTEREIRTELGEEREKLTEAVASLRTEVKAATDIGGKLKSNLPIAAAGAFGLGFLKAGGIGAAARLAFGARKR